MAIKLPQKKATQEATAPAAAAPKQAQQSQKQAAPAAKKAGSFSFIKKGVHAASAMAQEEKVAEDRKRQKDAGVGMHRYWLPDGKDGSVTFLSGEVATGGIGILDIPYVYEHQVYMGGNWRNWFICTQDTEPCPICEGGAKPYYAGFLLVIDHSEYTSKDGTKHKDELRLFVVKRDTIKTLLKYATKRDGLRGCRFDISRVGDKAASVGNVFDFTEKYTEGQLVNMYGAKANPVDLELMLQEMYMDAKELRKLGFGVLSAPVGSEAAPEESTDYSDQL